MFVIEEFKRIVSGSPDVTPRNLMGVRVACSGNAKEILARVREVLVTMLSLEVTCQNDEESLVDGAYQLLEEWFEADVLPFMNGDEVSSNTERVRQFGEDRDWFWWNATAVNENLIELAILVEGFPVSGFDNLRWLLHCCGAVSVEQGDMLGASGNG